MHTRKRDKFYCTNCVPATYFTNLGTFPTNTTSMTQYLIPPTLLFQNHTNRAIHIVVFNIDRAIRSNVNGVGTKYSPKVYLAGHKNHLAAYAGRQRRNHGQPTTSRRLWTNRTGRSTYRIVAPRCPKSLGWRPNRLHLIATTTDAAYRSTD